MPRFLLLSCLILPAACWAQNSAAKPKKDLDAPILPKRIVKDADAKEIKLGEDEPGCKDSALLPRVGKCSIIQCDSKESESIDIQIGASQDGVAQKESMEGASEVIYYLCPSNVSAGSIVKSLEGMLTKSGYKLVYSGKDDDESPLVTMLKDPQWIQISTYLYNEYSAYIFTAIKASPDSAGNAEALAEEIAKNGRVAIHGLTFTSEAELGADADKLLEDVAALLVRQPSWRIRVEGHGSDMETSTKRASAVASWLLEHGIDKSRLSIQGLGSTKPLVAGASEEAKAKNNRIELVRF